MLFGISFLNRLSTERTWNLFLGPRVLKAIRICVVCDVRHRASSHNLLPVRATQDPFFDMTNLFILN